MTGTFTGRHMAFAMAGMFGVVIGVNVTMAVLAARTATGLVAANGYVASIDYAQDERNRAAAARLGWTVAVTAAAGRVGVGVTDAAGAPVPVAVSGTREAAEGGERTALAFAPDADGAAAPLAAGGWIVRVHLAGDGGATLDWRAPVVVP